MQADLSPQLQEATQSLIDNLLASEVFVAYRQARTQFSADDEARTQLKQLSDLQASLRRKQIAGGVAQAEIDTLRTLQQQVQQNRILIEYTQAQQEAVNFLREINTEISGLLGLSFAALANHATC
jgi:cell fate (sporulation/competence/biofilm development) regulator YlbF (YheA/YmcA/DUF963 family)